MNEKHTGWQVESHVDGHTHNPMGVPVHNGAAIYILYTSSSEHLRCIGKKMAKLQSNVRTEI